MATRAQDGSLRAPDPSASLSAPRSPQKAPADQRTVAAPDPMDIQTSGQAPRSHGAETSDQLIAADADPMDTHTDEVGTSGNPAPSHADAGPAVQAAVGPALGMVPASSSPVTAKGACLSWEQIVRLACRILMSMSSNVPSELVMDWDGMTCCSLFMAAQGHARHYWVSQQTFCRRSQNKP